MTWVAATVALSMAGGLLAGRRYEDSAASAARRVLTGMLYVLVPPIVFVNIVRLEVTVETRRSPLEARPSGDGALMACAMHPNTGYLGLPLCVAVVVAALLLA